jgi:transposase
MASKHRERAVAIDVSAKELHVAVEGGDIGTFDNSVSGRNKLVTRLTKGGMKAKVVMEATGTYHVDLACLLAKHPRCMVSVVNPRTANHFHHAQNIRAKTDKVDAASLLQYALRMPFVPWICPSDAALELRSAARHVDQLVKEQTRMKNQLHAAGATSTSPDWVLGQLQRRLDDIGQMIAAGEQALLKMARKSPEINDAVERLDGVPGVGPATAVRLVAEFLFVQPDMRGSEITAWAGLDPRARESGTSVRGRRSMSKRGNARVRRLLYMPALTAVRKEGPLQRLHQRVKARSGHAMVGIGAVMRKLLVVTWAMYRHQEAWDPAKLEPRKVSAAA